MPRLVDLSQEIYQGMGVYPGHLKTVVWDHATHEETVWRFEGGFSFHSQGLMMCDHGPTHVDAISHLDPAEDAPSIDEMPLRHVLRAGAVHRRLARRAAGLHHRRRPGAGAGRSGQELERGDALLIRTGAFERHGGTPEYTQRLHRARRGGRATGSHERGVKIFGVDSPSPDNPISRTYPVHMMCRAQAHHALREPREPRPGDRPALHVRGLPAADPRRHREPRPRRRDRGGLDDALPEHRAGRHHLRADRRHPRQGGQPEPARAARRDRRAGHRGLARRARRSCTSTRATPTARTRWTRRSTTSCTSACARRPTRSSSSRPAAARGCRSRSG